VQEHYEQIKEKGDLNMQSKDIITVVAKYWANSSQEEKQVWKERAEALKEANEDAGSLLGEDITEKAIDAAEELVEDKVTTPKKKSAKRVITKVEV